MQHTYNPGNIFPLEEGESMLIQCDSNESYRYLHGVIDVFQAFIKRGVCDLVKNRCIAWTLTLDFLLDLFDPTASLSNLSHRFLNLPECVLSKWHFLCHVTFTCTVISSIGRSFKTDHYSVNFTPPNLACYLIAFKSFSCELGFFFNKIIFSAFLAKRRKESNQDVQVLQ